MFGSVGLLRAGSADISQSSHEGRGIAFDSARGHNTKRGIEKNVVIFGVDNKNTLNPKNRKSGFLVLGKGSTKFGPDEVEAEHGLNVNMSHQDERFVLSLHYADGGTSFMYVNGILMVNFTSKPMSEKNVKYYLGSITHGFKNPEQREMNFNGTVYEFSVDYRPIDRNNVLNIHAYLMKKYDVVNP